MHGAREDLASVRPSRRRTVAELTLLVLAAAAVRALRRRGTSGTSDEALDSGASATSALRRPTRLAGPGVDRRHRRAGPGPAVSAAAARAGPSRRPAAGRVGHLSLARAGRTSVSAVLPLLALLTALTTAAFGGSVLAGVADARDRAALLTVGADARVETEAALPATLPDRLRRHPGVTGVAP